jgi:preprotein translocase subunit SecD
VLVAGLATACGSGSSSDGASGPAPSTQALQMRPVYARYAVGAPLGGPQLGGQQVSNELVDTMKKFDCSSGTQDVQGMLMVCDSLGTVFLLKDPVLTGGVASADAKAIHGDKLWYVEVGLDPEATKTLSGIVDTMPGSELALVVDDHVISAPIVDSSMKDGTLGVTGDYNEKQAKALAAQLTQN